MKHTLLGILLLMWANHYDSADGQLARLTSIPALENLAKEADGQQKLQQINRYAGAGCG